MLFGKKDKAAADGGTIEETQAAAPAQTDAKAPAVDARAAKDSLTLVIDETEPGASCRCFDRRRRYRGPR